MEAKSKICKFFLQGNCKFTAEECRFSHQSSSSTKPSDPTRIVADKIHYRPKVTDDRKKIDDEYSAVPGKRQPGTGQKPPKNTESFEPSYAPADMRVLVEVAGDKEKSLLSLRSRDVVVIPDLFCKEEDLTIHDRLLGEMDKCGIDSDRLWKLWHGDSHMIADDSTMFKQKCPTFLKICDRVRDYFGMDIKATRFNLYRDDKDWKPFHFDASAVKPEKAKIQNITVGVSFGRTREIAFEDALERNGHRRVIGFPMPNGCTYAFCKDINVNWRHGVPAIAETEQTNKSRISLIFWGWRDQVDV